MSLEVIIGNHQDAVEIPVSWITALEEIGETAAAMALAEAAEEENSLEVALRQAEEYGEPLGREILRYFVHGLLHLAGHEDAEEAEQKSMEAAQEKIVAQLWADGLDLKLG